MVGEALWKKVLRAVLKVLVLFVFVSPFYIAVCYAVKTRKELAAGRLTFPKMIHWENFAEGIERSNFFLALKNSAVTTAITVVSLLVICSMAAYIIARRKSRFYNAMYFVMLGATLIPFQAIIAPLYSELSALNLMNTLFGYSLIQIAFQSAFTTLIITGFVKSIPLELEESAQIDGCGPYRTFWRIVFPLMKPIICTATVLATLSTWNDFQVSVVFLQNDEIKNLAIMQYYFFGKNTADLNYAFATFLLSMVPILALYFTFQRYIVSGITAGAVKCSAYPQVVSVSFLFLCGAC